MLALELFNKLVTKHYNPQQDGGRGYEADDERNSGKDKTITDGVVDACKTKLNDDVKLPVLPPGEQKIDATENGDDAGDDVAVTAKGTAVLAEQSNTDGSEKQPGVKTETLSDKESNEDESPEAKRRRLSVDGMTKDSLTTPTKDSGATTDGKANAESTPESKNREELVSCR